MGPAKRLQPKTALPDQSVDPSLTELVDLGVDDDWGRADGMVALLSWDALSGALRSGSDDLRKACVTLTSVGSGASLVLVRAAVMQTTAHHTDEQRLVQAGFRPRGRTGRWLRGVEPGGLAAVTRTLKGPLQVPHPRDLRFTLLGEDVARVRLLFGPLREQHRRPPAAALRSPTQDRSGPPCRRCGQPMIDPLSIARGYGPDCWDILTAM